jgi:hypothetical protein
MAKKIPVNNWIAKEIPANEPKPHKYERLIGVG